MQIGEVLLLLVDDLVEVLVEECGDLGFEVRVGWPVASVVGVLADVIRDVGHAWMIRSGVEAISASRKLVD